MTTSLLMELAVVAILGVVALALSRGLLPREHWLIGASVLAAVALFAVDPYSFGGVGGDEYLQVPHPWQRWVTVGSGTLLVVAVARLRRSRIDHARLLVLAEAMVFVATNAWYVIRDGWIVRSLRGFEASSLPMVAVALGVLARCVALTLLLRGKRAQPAHQT
jgi:hypothetical protein